MSNWTHINGAIRLDSVDTGNNFKKQEKEVAKILGPTWTFDDFTNTKKCLLPSGEEGSLQYTIIHYEKTDFITRMSICFWGDLRDRELNETIAEVKEYLKEIKSKLDRKGYWIRQGVIECSNTSNYEYINCVDI